MMSFWVVPARRDGSIPRSAATATYKASSHAAVALMVIEVFISSRGRSAKSVRISASVGTGTPTLPTSPRAIGSSGS